MLRKVQANMLKKAVIELVEAEIVADSAGSQTPADAAILRLQVKVARQSFNFLLKALTAEETPHG